MTLYWEGEGGWWAGSMGSLDTGQAYVLVNLLTLSQNKPVSQHLLKTPDLTYAVLVVSFLCLRLAHEWRYRLATPVWQRHRRKRVTRLGPFAPVGTLPISFIVVITGIRDGGP